MRMIQGYSDQKGKLYIDIFRWYFIIANVWNFMWYQKTSKKILPGTQNLCQIHNIQYIKLKENSNFKMGNLALTEILSVW